MFGRHILHRGIPMNRIRSLRYLLLAAPARLAGGAPMPTVPPGARRGRARLQAAGPERQVARARRTTAASGSRCTSIPRTRRRAARRRPASSATTSSPSATPARRSSASASTTSSRTRSSRRSTACRSRSSPTPTKETAKKYGVLKTYLGTMELAKRDTFLIDPQGKHRQALRRRRPEGSLADRAERHQGAVAEEDG